jgi:XTP/dITP diphosphohydrolase
MRTVNQIVLASNNYNKYLEMKALLAKVPGLELLQPAGLLRNADKIGAVETHATYLENASAKARLVNQGCHYPALGDDTGIEVLALDGKPGVRSARDWNVEKVLVGVKASSNREARFVCTLALAIEGTLLTATGILDGTLVDTPRGKNGFGYDSIFVPKGESRTLAEMTETEKNAISHRALAVAALLKECDTHGIQFVKP